MNPFIHSRDNNRSSFHGTNGLRTASSNGPMQSTHATIHEWSAMDNPLGGPMVQDPTNNPLGGPMAGQGEQQVHQRWNPICKPPTNF